MIENKISEIEANINISRLKKLISKISNAGNKLNNSGFFIALKNSVKPALQVFNTINLQLRKYIKIFNASNEIVTPKISNLLPIIIKTGYKINILRPQ